VIKRTNRFLIYVCSLIIILGMLGFLIDTKLTNSSWINSKETKINIGIVKFQKTDYSNNTFEIISNDDFISLGIPGLGIQSNPYRIKDYIISNSSTDIITIRDTDAYFVIENCTLNGLDKSFNGIYLENVTNGLIRNNTINTCYNAIELYGSYKNEFSKNILSNCFYNCFYIIESSINNNFSMNYCDMNNTGFHGFSVRYGSSYNRLVNNVISNVTSTGIYLSNSQGNIAAENNITNSQSSIVCNDQNHSLIYNNRINESSNTGIYLGSSLNITVQNNDMFDNFASIRIQDGHFCKIVDNDMYPVSLGIGVGQNLVTNVNNTIERNNIIWCANGISTISAINCSIKDNYIFYCGNSIRIGVYSLNNVVANNFVNRTDHGLYLGSNVNHTLVEWNSFHQIFQPLEDYGYFNTIQYNYYDVLTSPDNNSDGFVDIPYNYTGTTSNQDLYPLVGSSLLDDDEDGLTNFEEAVQGTNPQNPDSDADNISDIDEINIYLTNPLMNDTDLDGLDDFEEVTTGLDGFYTNPLLNDTDADSLDDWEEVNLGLDGYLTNPTMNDTDQDGLLDGEEYDYNSNPLIQDSDFDDLLDGEEVHIYSTSPTNNDTEGDGLPDGYEVTNSLNPLLDDAAEDPDIDDLTNLEEYEIGTDPHNPDTDGDTYTDGEEVAAGTDPLDPNDYPRPPPIPLLESILNDPESIIILVTISIVTTATVAILTVRSFLSSTINNLFSETGRGAIIADKVTATSQDKVKEVVSDVLDKIKRYGFCPKCKTNAIGPICYLCGTTIDYDKVADLEKNSQKSIPDEAFEEKIEFEEE